LTFKDLKKRVSIEAAISNPSYSRFAKINHFGFRIFSSINKKMLERMEAAVLIIYLVYLPREE
jgi:hypothetical protein